MKMLNILHQNRWFCSSGYLHLWFPTSCYPKHNKIVRVIQQSVKQLDIKGSSINQPNGTLTVLSLRRFRSRKHCSHCLK